MSHLRTVCISTTCVLGMVALWSWRIFPIPNSPPGQPMNLTRSLAVIGYMFGFALVGGLLAEALAALYRLAGGQLQPEVAKKTIEQIVSEATEKIHAALGTNLSGLVLYGSQARGETHAHSDINLFVLVRDGTPDQLIGLARVFPSLAKHGVGPPVVMSEEEFGASQDTFALEFLDMAAHRRVLEGKDPFEQFEPRWDGLRMQIERELRTKMLQLYRQWYVSEEKPEALKALLRGSLSSFLTLLRGIVALEKKQVVVIPQEKLIDEIAGERGLDAALWRRFRQVTRGEIKISADDMRSLFRSYLAEVKKLTAYVDKLKV